MDQHAPRKYQSTNKFWQFIYLAQPNPLSQAPITLLVQLANYTDKPEWNLNGTVITVPEVPLTLLVSSLRDRIIAHVKANIPASRIRLSFRSKMLTNANTLASYNMDDDDLIVMTLKEARR